jgi:hypothetical protein
MNCGISPWTADPRGWFVMAMRGRKGIILQPSPPSLTLQVGTKTPKTRPNFATGTVSSGRKTFAPPSYLRQSQQSSPWSQQNSPWMQLILKRGLPPGRERPQAILRTR